MVYTVTCYKETGFSRGNIPSSPSVLENAAKITLTANQIWKLQDRFLSQVKLSMSWEDAQTVDYMKVGNNYYTVEGVEMSNGNVAIFTLALDPITSVGGVSGFTLIDGWAKRCSPREDNLFGNILPEPWAPTNELKMDGPVSMTDSYYEAVLNSYVVSTIDLTDTERIAVAYQSADPTTEEVFTVAVPQVNSLSVDQMTNVKLVPDEDLPTGWKIWSYTMPGACIYVINNVLDDITRARSLGLMDAITAAYSVPTMYAVPTGNGSGGVGIMEGRIREYDAESMPYQYGTYAPKNKKVFALYNMYQIRSVASGELGNFEARELYSGGQYPGFWIYADPSPEGKPYCQPIWYEGARTIQFQNSISGAQWLTAPIAFSGQRGQMLAQTKANMIAEDQAYTLYKFQANLALGKTGADSGAGGVLEGIFGNLFAPVRAFGAQLALARRVGSGGTVSAQEYAGWAAGPEGVYQQYEMARDMERERFNFNVENRLVVPEVAFAQEPNMQYFVGNGFFIDRLRLTENDMERLDNFLTMYGYADDRRLEQADFTSHTHFNFVQADNVAVEGPSMYMCNLISEYFSGGVRLWHELPNRAAMSDNPIRS